MSQATIGALRVTLGLDSAAFTDGLSAAQAHLRGAGRRMQAVGTQIATVGAGMSAAITAPFVALGFHLLQGSQDAARAAGQVNAALDSMGDASGRTFEQLEQAAVGLRNLSGFDDDDPATFRITLPDGSTFGYDGLITEHPVDDVAIDDKIGMSANIKVTGPVTFTAGA